MPILLVIFLLLVFHRAVLPKYHPGIKWKEISNEQFIVVFPEGYRDDAVYTLNTAQQIYERLSQLWGMKIPGKSKTRILISDVADDSNGSATFFPYNHIVVYLFTPPPDSTIGSGRDWIRLVLTHELTHIINFNTGSGFTYFMRKILGANPVLYPVIYVPAWILEGLAVYAESQINEGGRLNTPDYKLMLTHIAKAGKIPGWGDFWGAPTSWPGRTSKYLYGAAFVNFLAEKYGHQKIPELIKTFAHCPLPFTFTRGLEPKKLNIHERFRQVFEKNTRELWEEFRQHIQPGVQQKNPIQVDSIDSTDNADNKITFLTQQGKFKKYPIFAENGKIFFVNHNYIEYPGIFLLDINTGKSRRLIKKSGINSLYYSSLENKIYFSAADYYRAFYWFSDIYSLDLKTDEVKRLTRGERLFYPSQHPTDKNKIYCVKRENTRSYLSVLDISTGRSKILSRGFDSIAYIAVSPDNRYIAVSLKRKHHPWAIALFSPEGRLDKILAHQGKCYYPVWKNAEELFFICLHESNYCLAAVNLKTNHFYIYDDPHIPGIRFFSFQSGKNKQKLVGSFFDSRGYNLGIVKNYQFQYTKYKLNPQYKYPITNPENQNSTIKEPPQKKLFAEASWEQGALRPRAPISDGFFTGDGFDNSTCTGNLPPLAGKSPPVKPYNFLRDLLPKYISGYLRYSGSEFKPGVILSGQDIFSRNSFIFEALYGFRSKTTNYIFTYIYDGLFPTLSVRYSDLSDFNTSSDYGNFVHNERKLQLEGTFPLLIKARSKAYFYTNIHFETFTDRFLNFSHQDRLNLNGIKLGIFHNSAQRYYDSISPADGMGFSLSYSRELKLMGSDFDINTAAFQYKHYISLIRPNVLAFHLGVMDSWGEAKRLFYMGGAESKEGFQLAGDDLFDLMRGYPSGYLLGTGGYLLNIEYRISLFKIEKAFWISKSVERFYLSLFADIGQVWVKKWNLNPSYSLGMELNLLAFLGGVKLNISAGIAAGLNPYHSPLVYLRIGNSF